MTIYVEIFIRGNLEKVWSLSQTPDQHARWDLRFTDIRYLPRPDPALPQRFLYETRIGFGLRIAGEGESVASREDATGARTSSLRFWSDDPKSLIRAGSGYWRYVPTDGGVRFLTRYHYDTRFGRPGRVFNALVFEPLLGWATAWSFDRLRLWVEQDLDPRMALCRALVHTASPLLLAAALLTNSAKLTKIVVGGFAVAAYIARLGAPTAATCLRLFGYRGHFQVEWRPVPVGEIPARVLPRRVEKRE